MGALVGKVAIVTGAGRGIGRGEALLLATEGARVVVNDLGGEWDGTGADNRPAQQVVDEIKAAGGEAVANYDNVADWAGAERLVRQAIDTFGTLDVLVNNAGIAILAPAETAPLDDVRLVFEVDVFGVIAFAKEAFRPMRDQGKGCIINMASMAGITVLRPQEHVGYNAAKAAVIMVTKSLAVEWAEFGIRVNAIAPGYMLTPPVVELCGDDPERWSAWMDGVPMARAGEPQELQGAAVYLASDSASYVTGSVVVVDGGYSCA